MANVNIDKYLSSKSRNSYAQTADNGKSLDYEDFPSLDYEDFLHVQHELMKLFPEIQDISKADYFDSYTSKATEKIKMFYPGKYKTKEETQEAFKKYAKAEIIAVIESLEKEAIGYGYKLKPYTTDDIQDLINEI